MVVVVAKARSQPSGQEFLDHGRGEDVVAEPQPQVLAAHRGVHVQQAVPEEAPVTQRAWDILMAPEISTGDEELDHGPAGIRISGEEYADMAELVCRAA